MRRRQGIGVELLARSGLAPVVAIPDAGLAGNAGFIARHGDVDRVNAGKKIRSKTGVMERAHDARLWLGVF